MFAPGDGTVCTQNWAFVVNSVQNYPQYPPRLNLEELLSLSQSTKIIVLEEINYLYGLLCSVRKVIYS